MTIVKGLFNTVFGSPFNKAKEKNVKKLLGAFQDRPRLIAHPVIKAFVAQDLHVRTRIIDPLRIFVEPVKAPVIGYIDHDQHTHTDPDCQSPDI
jgi:hypothetical protein